MNSFLSLKNTLSEIVDPADEISKEFPGAKKIDIKPKEKKNGEDVYTVVVDDKEHDVSVKAGKVIRKVQNTH